MICAARYFRSYSYDLILSSRKSDTEEDATEKLGHGWLCVVESEEVAESRVLRLSHLLVEHDDISKLLPNPKSIDLSESDP